MKFKVGDRVRTKAVTNAFPGAYSFGHLGLTGQVVEVYVNDFSPPHVLPYKVMLDVPPPGGQYRDYLFYGNEIELVPDLNVTAGEVADALVSLAADLSNKLNFWAEQLRPGGS